MSSLLSGFESVEVEMTPGKPWHSPSTVMLVDIVAPVLVA